MKRIFLKPGRERAVQRRHHWIFSGGIERTDSEVNSGDVVEVFSAEGSYLATGHYADSSIAVKVLTFAPERLDSSYWLTSFKRAFHLRASLGLTDHSETTAYRLINSEGDGLPGLIVDLYGKVAVLQCHSIGMLHSRQEICAALRELLGTNLVAIADKSADVLDEESGGKSAGIP